MKSILVKRRLKNWGGEMKKYLKYICEAENHPIDGFTLFARIIEEKNGKITFERFMRKGELNCGIVTFPKDDFWRFYRKCKADEFIVVEV